MKTTTEILKEVFDEMPFQFTSNAFTRKAALHGITKSPHQGFGDFLRKYAKNDPNYTRTWTKKTNNNRTEPKKETQITEEYAIQFLKARGYKIFKTVSELKEI
jgi:hypothetical protein